MQTGRRIRKRRRASSRCSMGNRSTVGSTRGIGKSRTESSPDREKAVRWSTKKPRSPTISSCASSGKWARAATAGSITEILDNGKHSDGINPRTSAGSLYFGMAPSKDATRPAGEWNTGRIVCQGTVIQHWVNGEKVIDFDYSDPQWAKDVARLKERGGDVAARGAFLSLQDHGDPVWYRSIRMRAIPDGEKIEHATVQPAPISPEALKKEAAILERIRKNREAIKKAVKGK